MKVLVIRLKGIHCGSCLNSIEKLSKDQGAIKVDINLETNITKFYYESMDIEKAIADIKQRGYTVEKLTTYEEVDL